MSAPTQIERDHYAKLEGLALPVLLLAGWDRDGHRAHGSRGQRPGASGSQFVIVVIPDAPR